MKGNELYLKLSKRDYTQTGKDQYSQLLKTLFFHLASSGEIEKFYNLLENAEIQNKKIFLKENRDKKDEYFFEDLTLQ